MTNADKVHAINQLVGDHEMPTCWGFGKRRVKGAVLTLQEHSRERPCPSLGLAVLP